jgi:ribosome-binding protein aMBF1 (putative translation factor)
MYQFRKYAGWSRNKLAQQMRCTSMSISLWETGQIIPGTMAWSQFTRVRRNYRQKLRRQGVDLDGGPLMG